MAQISVHSLWHYICEIKTEEQTLRFYKNIPATDEMNIMNYCMPVKELGKKQFSILHASTNVMVGMLLMAVNVTQSHVRRG